MCNVPVKIQTNKLPNEKKNYSLKPFYDTVPRSRINSYFSHVCVNRWVYRPQIVMIQQCGLKRTCAVRLKRKVV